MMSYPLLAQTEATTTGSRQGSGSAATAAPDGGVGTSRAQLVEYGLAIAAIVVIAVVAQRLMRGSTELSARGEGLPRALRAELKTRELRGDHAGAAELLFEAGKLAEAADSFIEAGDFLRAGECYDRADNVGKATVMFRKAGAPERAAALLARRGQFELAAKEFLIAERPEKAAEIYTKRGDHRAAAGAFLQAKLLREAAEAFDRAGDSAKATEQRVALFDRDFARNGGNLAAMKSAVEAAQTAAKHLEAHGNIAGAASLLNRAGFPKAAAELLERAGDLAAAEAIYAEKGRHGIAAEMYERAGRADDALRLRVAAANALPEPSQQGEALQKIGRLADAAAKFTEAGDSLRAAGCYEALGEHRIAGLLFADLGADDDAVRCLTACNAHAEVAEIFARSGNATAELEALGRANNLQRLAHRMLELGRFRELVALVQPTLSLAALKPSDASLGYTLARALEALEEQAAAADWYRAVVTASPGFRDAAARAAALTKTVAPPTPTAPSRTAPSATGRYRIIEEIARGGMGVVYKATDTALDRVVAFKVLAENLKANEVAVGYFLREAKAAAKMIHPNIVTVFDTGEQDGEFYMAMEFVDGETLKAMVQRQGAFPEKLVRYAFVHAAKALDYAHDQGLIHRDVKPGNMMLGADRSLKLMDFGLAKFVSEMTSSKTRSIGTPYYISPEQITGAQLDGRSDMYSLGVSMFEIATGQLPYAKGDLTYLHLHGEIPKACELVPGLSVSLSEVIERCMAKRPEDRFENMKALIAAVR
jgi:tetratricopeptide (TPR) repeat protein